MSVEFLEDKNYAHITLGYSITINLAGGKVKYIDTTEEDHLKLENCV